MLESAAGCCAGAVPGLATVVPEPGVAVPEPVAEVPGPPAWSPKSDPTAVGVRRHEDGTGFRRRLDRWLEEALEGDAGWYSLPGGAYSCQGICLLIVVPWHVEEIAPLKVSADLLNEETIACHVCVLGVPITE